MNKLYEQYKSKGLTVIGVCGNRDKEQTAQTWKNSQFTMPCIQNDTGDSNIRHLFGVETEPVVLILDSRGVLVARYNDYYPKDVQAVLSKLGIK